MLLDQRVIAGLGNIYAAEALVAARSVAARQRPPIVCQRKQVGALLAAIRQVIKARDRSTLHRFVESHGSRCTIAKGKPCRRCRTTIERIVQAGRSTYYCPVVRLN